MATFRCSSDHLSGGYPTRDITITTSIPPEDFDDEEEIDARARDLYDRVLNQQVCSSFPSTSAVPSSTRTSSALWPSIPPPSAEPAKQQHQQQGSSGALANLSFPLALLSSAPSSSSSFSLPLRPSLPSSLTLLSSSPLLKSSPMASAPPPLLEPLQSMVSQPEGKKNRARGRPKENGSAKESKGDDSGIDESIPQPVTTMQRQLQRLRTTGIRGFRAALVAHVTAQMHRAFSSSATSAPAQFMSPEKREQWLAKYAMDITDATFDQLIQESRSRQFNCSDYLILVPSWHVVRERLFAELRKRSPLPTHVASRRFTRKSHLINLCLELRYDFSKFCKAKESHANRKRPVVVDGVCMPLASRSSPSILRSRKRSRQDASFGVDSSGDAATEEDGDDSKEEGDDDGDEMDERSDNKDSEIESRKARVSDLQEAVPPVALVADRQPRVSPLAVIANATTDFSSAGSVVQLCRALPKSEFAQLREWFREIERRFPFVSPSPSAPACSPGASPPSSSSTASPLSASASSSPSTASSNASTSSSSLPSLFSSRIEVD